MAYGDLAYLQTRVLSNLIDTPQAVQDNIQTFIQAAIDAIQNMHRFKCMQSEVEFKTQAGNHFLGAVPTTTGELGITLPAFLGPRGNPYYVLSAGNARTLDWLPNREYIYRQWNPSDPNAKGPPRTLFLAESNLNFVSTGITGTTHSNLTVDTLSSDVFNLDPVGWQPGMGIAGAGIPAGTTIASIANGGLGITLSQAANASAAGVALTVTSSQDLFLTNQVIEVYPYPDGLSDWAVTPSGEYRVHVPYWGRLPALATGASSNWFTQNATEYVVAHATMMGFLQDWDEQRAQIWQVQAWGPKYDGATIASVGGWARHTLDLDKVVGFQPGRVLVPRTDQYGPRDQFRT